MAVVEVDGELTEIGSSRRSGFGTNLVVVCSWCARHGRAFQGGGGIGSGLSVSFLRCGSRSCDEGVACRCWRYGVSFKVHAFINLVQTLFGTEVSSRAMSWLSVRVLTVRRTVASKAFMLFSV